MAFITLFFAFPLFPFKDVIFRIFHLLENCPSLEREIERVRMGPKVEEEMTMEMMTRTMTMMTTPRKGRMSLKFLELGCPLVLLYPFVVQDYLFPNLMKQRWLG